MALETKDQININYNTFFYATMCHVCKRFDVPLMICSDCKLISYCSIQHQRQHWPQHKLLCKAVQDVLKDDGLEKLEITPDDSSYAKVTLTKAVEKKKGSLELHEKHMLWFPIECAVCKERNTEPLLVCQKCAISFCKDHEDNIAHKNACAALELCLRINLSIMNGHDTSKHFNTFLEHSFKTETFNMFRDMHDFINGYGNIQEVHSEISYDVLAAGLSEHLTRPLTLLYAMRVLNYVPKRKKQVLHVVAVTNIEKFILKMWEIFLHLILETEVSLVIVMIRSELNASYSLSTCDNCLSRGKEISFEFFSGLYENYVRSVSFAKPDYAVGFDVNIQVEGGTYITEITTLSIKMLAKQNCPFVITNYTQKALEESIKRINTILNGKVDLVYSGKNPYASLRPCRRNAGRELVFFHNNFIAVYRSLCS